MDVKEQIALAILKGAGGDVDKDYTSTNAIYKEVESIYRAQDNRQDVESLQVELVDNGTYTYDDRNTQGYKPVEITVNVPVDDYYNSGFENGIVIQKAKLEAITITENGIYNKEDGYDEVEVNIDTQSYYDNGYNNGTQDQKSKLESITITENGIYNKEDGYNNVDVNIDTQSYYDNGYNNGYSEGDNNGYERGYGEGVDSGIQEQKAKLESITITENGTYNKDDGYNKVDVNIDTQSYYDDGYNNGYSEGDNNGYERGYGEGDNNGYERGYGEGVDSGIQEQKSKLESITIESNGTYIKEDGYNEVKVALDIPKTKIYNGFRFVSEGNNDYKLIKDIDFSLYDWSGVYELEKFFAGFKSTDKGALLTSDFDNFIRDFDGEILSCNNMFNGTNALKEAPNFGDKTKNCLNMSHMFSDCSNLIYIPQFNTSNAISMAYMFSGCYLLTSIPQLNTSNVTNMSYMFNACEKLTSIPQLDTSNVTSMRNMFNACKKLTSIPQLNTSNVTNMSYMFYNCNELTSIPQLDTSNVTNMSYMFGDCPKLTSIPQLDTSNVTYMGSMFQYCTGLTSIPLLNCQNVTNMNTIFGGTALNNITDLGGFKDLGKQNSVSGTNNFFLDCAPNLTHESLMNIINNLYDRKTAGYSTLTLNMGSTNLNKLTDEEKAIAVNKGWNLS